MSPAMPIGDASVCRVRMTTAMVVLIAYGLNVGCSSIREVPVAEAKQAEKVAAVVYHSGEVLEFGEQGGIVNYFRGTIDGTTEQGKVVSVPLKQVAAIRAQRTNLTTTLLWTVGSIAVIVGTLAVIIEASGPWFSIGEY